MQRYNVLSAFCLALLALGTLSCGGGGGSATAPVTYTFVSTDPVSTGGDVTLVKVSSDTAGNIVLDIRINTVANVWGIKFHLSYNPMVLDYISPASKTGSALADGKCGAACLILIDAEGTAVGKAVISLTRSCNTVVTPPPCTAASQGGITVNGAVVRIAFKAVGKGNINFAFTNTEARDPSGALIAPTPVWKADPAARVD